MEGFDNVLTAYSIKFNAFDFDAIQLVLSLENKFVKVNDELLTMVGWFFESSKNSQLSA
jgi:hypothetical protein